MQYDPQTLSGRKYLAGMLLADLNTWGFIEEYHSATVVGDITLERVFYYPIPERNLRVVVYTSIVDDAVREVGEDAIRVVLLYRAESDGQNRAIAKETRVHRTGEVDAICERVHERCRDAYQKGAGELERCPKCGAPMFQGKNKKKWCAEICWKNPSRRESCQY